MDNNLRPPLRTTPDGYLPAEVSAYILDLVAQYRGETGTVETANIPADARVRICSAVSGYTGTQDEETYIREALELIDKESEAIETFSAWYGEHDGIEIDPKAEESAAKARRSYAHMNNGDRMYWMAAMSTSGILEAMAVLRTVSAYALHRHLVLRGLRGNAPGVEDYEEEEFDG